MPNGIFRKPPFHSHPADADPGGRGHDRAARRTQPRRDHLAAPEQIDHGFEEGFLRAPRSAQTRRVGRFSTGGERLPSSDRRGRFSGGLEQPPETLDKTAERRFSEGIERKLSR